MSVINIGIVGAGTIGGGVIKILDAQILFFNKELALPINLKRIADTNIEIFKTLPTNNAICTNSADDILNDDEIHIVIELVGGTLFAKKLVIAALKKGKHVITANKALLAEFGPEIFTVAHKNHVSVFFEAAVGGGMPSIKTIRESMIGNDVLSVKTIINGTCNYILSQMSEKNLPFNEVLKAAQDAGFAESDPTLDIEGGDTAHKLAIIASLLYGGYVPCEKIPTDGIVGITSDDITYANDMGYEIKLLGIIKKEAGRGNDVDVRVHPAMVKKSAILASVKQEFNAILIVGDSVGPVLLYGKGAGEMPTASAVISDVVDIARNIINNSPNRIPMGYYNSDNEMNLKPIDDVENRYYLRFNVIDKISVLATIATELGQNNISIASIRQKEAENSDTISVVFITHKAKEKYLKTAISIIEQNDFIKEKTQIIRIEDNA